VGGEKFALHDLFSKDRSVWKRGRNSFPLLTKRGHVAHGSRPGKGKKMVWAYFRGKGGESRSAVEEGKGDASLFS